MSVVKMASGSQGGATWCWWTHHGWPVLAIKDIHGDMATIAPEHVRALMKFLEEKSPDAMEKELQDVYDAMEKEAEAEEKAIEEYNKKQSKKKKG